MLARSGVRSQGFNPQMKLFAQWALAFFAAVAMPIAGCAGMGSSAQTPMQAVSSDGDVRPFGGRLPVDIPPAAYAMGAYLKAEVATDDGDRQEALKQYEEASKFDPHNAELHVQIATLYVRDGRLKDALEQANDAIALDPSNDRARLLAAGIETAQGDDDAAVKQYQEVMKLSPTNQESYLFLGTLYAKRGDYAKAEDIFKQLIALDPTSFLGYYYAGRVMVGAKNYPAADAYYQKALDINPDSQLVLLDLAVLRELQGRPKDAIALYQKILQTDPNNDEVHKRLAVLYGGDKSVDTAVTQQLQREEQLETNPSDTRTKIGLLFFERGDFDRAATEFNLVLGSEPNNYRVHYYLGTVYSELDEDDKAVTEFQKISPGADHYVESRLQLAYLYDKALKYDDAIKVLNEALAQRPDDSEIL